MAEPILEGVRVCAFDAYGTLFDFISAAARERERIRVPFERFAALWRDKQLQYTWLRTAQGKHADFWQVTGDALDFTFATLGLKDAALRARLMDLYLRLDPFVDARPTLERLKASGMQTAILSNGSPAMLAPLIEHAGFAPLIDAALSVEQAGVFKPHPKVYRLVPDHFGVAPEAIAFMSSNAWDAYAASAFGMRVVWCNRYGQAREHLPGKPDHEVQSLAELPALLGLA